MFLRFASGIKRGKHTLADNNQKYTIPIIDIPVKIMPALGA